MLVNANRYAPVGVTETSYIRIFCKQSLQEIRNVGVWGSSTPPKKTPPKKRGFPSQKVLSFIVRLAKNLERIA